jgi:protein-S-isoprenylcysteine O-methyltransferase Ste14
MALLDILAWANFFSLNISAFLFGYLSILSVMPVTRSERKGKKAWKECKNLRLISSVFAFIMIGNIILWVWIPIPLLNWLIHPNPTIPILIAVLIAFPCIIIMIIATRDAGKEMMEPIPETKMHKGIYNHLRHPGALGEMPLYICVTLLINSLFLFLWVTLLVVLYTPIMIYFEEKDLIKRFGNEYREYRERTGALFPRLRKNQVK